MATDRARANGGGLLRPLIVLAAFCFAGAVARPAHAQYVGKVSSYVLDANTGQVLQQYNPDLQRFPASLTKLMTLYLAFQALRDNRIALDQAVPVSAHAASMEPSKLGLVPGSYVTVEQAILALVTKSANDAACALGELLGGGSEERFGQIMTQQARLLGMRDTTFRNASGLPDPEQVSTARDFGTLALHLIRDFPDQYHYFSVPAFMFHGRYIANHDPMLRIYPGADGLKTGYTADAGRNLVSSAIRGNVRLIGVLLGASSNTQRAAMMANLLDAGFQREGVPIMERPLIVASARSANPRSANPRSANHRGRASLVMVSDDNMAGPIAHGRHRLHRGRHGRAAVHLAVARYAGAHSASHGARHVHLAGARVRRIMAHGVMMHGHRRVRLRLTSVLFTTSAHSGGDQEG